MIFDPHSSSRLTGKHATLYQESLATMLDLYRDCIVVQDHQWEWIFGITMFDELDWHQQLELVLDVSKSALQGTGDPDNWSAVQKAAYFAVYRNVFQQMEIDRDFRSMNTSGIERSLVDRDWENDDSVEFDDIDYGDDEDSDWKRLIEQAYEERCLEDGMSPEEIEDVLDHDSESDDLCHWETLLDCLADQLLVDRDFELAPTLMDIDPEVSSAIKAQLGIDQNYFIDTVQEPDCQRVKEVFRELLKLAGLPDAIRPDDAPF